MILAFQAAKTKRPSVEEPPTRSPMAPRSSDRRNPSTDQKKVRREMTKKAVSAVSGPVIILRNTGPGTAELVFPDGYTSSVHLIDGIADNTDYEIAVIKEMVSDVRSAAQTGIYTVEVPIYPESPLYAEGARVHGSRVAKTPSDVCPKCGSRMTDVKVYGPYPAQSGSTLRASCDSCGWKGSKTIAAGAARIAMEGLPMQPPSGGGAMDPVQQMDDDNAEPAPLGGGTASLHTAGYFTVNGRGFDYSYEVDPESDDYYSPDLVVYLLDPDTGDVFDAMGGVSVEFELSDHGNVNVGPEAEAYIKGVAAEMAGSMYVKASLRFEPIQPPPRGYLTALATARSAIVSGARDAARYNS